MEVGMDVDLYSVVERHSRSMSPATTFHLRAYARCAVEVFERSMDVQDLDRAIEARFGMHGPFGWHFAMAVVSAEPDYVVSRGPAYWSSVSLREGYTRLEQLGGKWSPRGETFMEESLWFVSDSTTYRVLCGGRLPEELRTLDHLWDRWHEAVDRRDHDEVGRIESAMRQIRERLLPELPSPGQAAETFRSSVEEYVVWVYSDIRFFEIGSGLRLDLYLPSPWPRRRPSSQEELVDQVKADAEWVHEAVYFWSQSVMKYAFCVDALARLWMLHHRDPDVEAAARWAGDVVVDAFGRHGRDAFHRGVQRGMELVRREALSRWKY